MKTINASNKQQAIIIASESFKDNPSMNWFLNKKMNKEKAMQALCLYCIDLAIEKGGAFISDDGCCVCLIYKHNAKMSWLKEIKLNYFFLNTCCGWGNLLKVLKRTKSVKKLRGTEEHLYGFLLASNKAAGNASVIEAKAFMFDLSKSLQLPIYAETCIEQNKKIYERYGFKTYNAYKIPETQNTLWFLKRQV